MWTCSNCNSRNWENATICCNCGRSSEGKFVIRQQKRPGDTYTVTLSPGVVGYFDLNAVAANGIEELIDYLHALTPEPDIKCPPSIALADSLVAGEKWDDRLRMHHSYERLCRERQLPRCLYYCFHKCMELRNIAFEECLGAWVKEAWGNEDLTESYGKSAEYLILTCDRSSGCVFKKTPFVQAQLEIMAEHARQQNEDKQLTDDARMAAEDLERLKKSNFSTYVYVMEDMRNGLFKIGRSITPNKRERTLQSEVPEVVLRLSIPADEGHEAELHQHFASKRIRGEWFELSPDDLIWISNFLKQRGDSDRASIDYQWLGAVFFRSTQNAE